MDFPLEEESRTLNSEAQEQEQQSQNPAFDRAALLLSCTPRHHLSQVWSTCIQSVSYTYPAGPCKACCPPPPMPRFTFFHCEILSTASGSDCESRSFLSHTTTSISSEDNTESEPSILSVPVMPRLELGRSEEGKGDGVGV